jgi:predicted phage tail protein
MALIKIKLFGELATKFTKEFSAEVRTVRDAIAALEVNFKGFREYLLNSDSMGVDFKVLIGETWELCKPDEVFLPIPQRREICITPVVRGSGKVGRIIAGVALIGLGIAGVGFLGLSAFQVGLLGGSLLLGGLFGGQTSAPDPETEEAKSYIFNGPTNTVAQGNRVPIVFGTLLVGSQVISASIKSYQIPG